MTFKPLADFVVIERDEVVTTTSGGLLLALGSLERPQTGTVVSVGPDVTEVVAGDKVFYSNRAGAEYTIDEAKVFILKEENIIGVLD